MASRRVGLWSTAGLTVVGILWLAWAWSPSPAPLEPEPARELETPELPTPVAPTVAQPTVVEPPDVAKEVTAAPEPLAAQPSEVEVAARVPTPHPMSLDQTRPPEAWGSLRELKRMYDTQSRQAESTEHESKLRGLLASPNIPADLIDELSCRRTVCRLRLRWQPSRRLGYVVVFESLKHLYNQHVAVEPAETQDADGIYLTTLYVQLQ